MAGLLTTVALDADALERDAREHIGSALGRELWKYTPVAAFAEALGEAPASPALRVLGQDQPGVTVTRLDRPADVPWLRAAVAAQRQAERYPLVDLAWVRAHGAWLISIDGEPAGPIVVDYREGGLVPVAVRLAPGARAQLVERVDAATFLAQTTLITLEADARLEHQRHALGAGNGHYASLNVRLADRAGYRLDHALVGGRRRRTEVHVLVDGRGADAELCGAYVVTDGTHLDQQVVLEHRSGGSTSRQTFHGIGAGKGRSVFNGRIHIHPGASGTDATLSNRNLATHPDAEMNTKPELEIYTDDVRCAHGATVGQMSADSLFYLTSRGIPSDRARRLLCHGFLRQCLWGSESEAAAERLLAALT